MIDKARKGFLDTFHNECDYVFYSAGRVNLIGEHIDYNGGRVLPVALSIGTYGAVSFRQDTKVRLLSNAFMQNGIIEFDCNEDFVKENVWADYVKAVVAVFKAHGKKITRGFDIYVIGNIPNGAGLSSSASLELLALEVLCKSENVYLNPIEMAQYTQEAENKYIGVNCGIMDQFAIAAGKKDKAILLNTETLD